MYDGFMMAVVVEQGAGNRHCTPTCVLETVNTRNAPLRYKFKVDRTIEAQRGSAVAYEVY